MVLLLIVAEAAAKDISNIYGKRGVSADSIMEKVIFFAPFYESIVNEYRAELYIKGRVNIRKKNHIIRFFTYNVPDTEGGERIYDGDLQ